MKGLKTYLITGGILLTIYIIAMANRPKAINWNETFSSKDKIPYGTYILRQRLNDIFPGSIISPYRRPPYNVIAEDSVANSSYIIISQYIEFSKPDYEQLIKYVKAGNDVFIASEYFGRLFRKNLKVETSTYYEIKNNENSIHFLNPLLNPERSYNIGKGAGDTQFGSFDTLKSVVIGENNKHQANFIKYKMGRGWLYLMTNPKYFSNYSLLKPDGAAYAATSLSFIKNTGKIIWDEYYTQGDSSDDSIMRLFLSNETLEWAYYITIISLIIFVLYEIKRRQRIIPVIEPLANSTLNFVNVVGQVYYEKRDNANIAHKKILYLLEHLRDEYQVRTNKLDAEFIEKLQTKLGLQAAFANELVNFIQYIAGQSYVSDQDLINLNKLIEQFYIKSA